jgi:hypothetical protein
MMRLLAILTATMLMSGFSPVAGVIATSEQDLPQCAVAQQGCCKICTQGKACGNTCISRDKICHVGPGCACDG